MTPTDRTPTRRLQPPNTCVCCCDGQGFYARPCPSCGRQKVGTPPSLLRPPAPAASEEQAGRQEGSDE